MSERKYIKLNIEKNIATITIDHPPVNALSTPVVAEFDEVLEQCINDPEVKAIIVTGAGMFFIAGADIKEIAKIENGEIGTKLAAQGQKVISKLENSPKPTIAAINGLCLGGGLELAMACHIRVCSDRAKLGQPEINLGIIPGFGGTQRLPRLVGKAKAFEMILTGDQISAKTAFEIGLVNYVVPSANVLKVAKGIAQKIASKGAVAVKLAIEAINKGIELPIEKGLELEAKLFGKICETEDMKEGVTAFLEKRRPVFKGK